MKIVTDEEIMDEIDVADLLVLVGHSYIFKKGQGYNMDSPSLQKANRLFPELKNVLENTLTQRKKRQKVFNFLSTKDTLEYKEIGIGATHIALFQNRIKVGDGASVEQIKASARHLSFWADKWPRIALEYPDPKQDYPLTMITDILSILPDNVFLYAPSETSKEKAALFSMYCRNCYMETLHYPIIGKWLKCPSCGSIRSR